jgi:transcriptional regulator with AAA-type ATPase domain
MMRPPFSAEFSRFQPLRPPISATHSPLARFSSGGAYGSRPSVVPARPLDRLLGEAPALPALRGRIRHLARFDAVGNPVVPRVLLQGETGTGSGLVARVIRASCPCASGPFIQVEGW